MNIDLSFILLLAGAIVFLVGAFRQKIFGTVKPLLLGLSLVTFSFAVSHVGG